MNNNIYIYLLDSANTAAIIENKKYDGNAENYRYSDMWGEFFNELFSDFTIKNGFDNVYIEPNAICFFYVVDINHYPLEILNRKDLFKIAYMAEPPINWHGHSYKKEILKLYFNQVFTYWTPLIKDNNYNPFVYQLDPRNELHRSLIRNGVLRKYDKSIGIILANRPNNEKYQINEIPLKRLDYLRSSYVQALSNKGLTITCRGNGWDGEHNRFVDPVTTYDYLCNFNFALIVENSNGDGYVSEKIYDAFIAGCIPIYYGGNNSQLDIPKSTYIDLRDIDINKISDYIINMSHEEMQRIYDNIDHYLLDILEKVSSYKFCQKIKNLILEEKYKKSLPSVAVITASIGRDELKDTILSVANQTYNVSHYVFVNGNEFAERANSVLSKNWHPNLRINYINESTGRFRYGDAGEYDVPDGDYGPCGIYAAAPYLSSQDIIMYLNDDDFWEPDHVHSLISFMTEHNLDWAHSMRNVCSKTKEFICQDNCEALGAFHTCISEDDFLIECSGFAIKKSVMMKAANVWMYPHICDRVLAKHLIQNYPNFGSPGKFTHWFRLGGNEKSASAEFFIAGNEKFKARFPDGYPWGNGYIHRAATPS